VVEEGPRPVCSFLIPVVRDSDRRSHAPVVWRLLQDALLRTFGALTGPEAVLYYRKPDDVPGAWRPEEGEELVGDRAENIRSRSQRTAWTNFERSCGGPAIPSTSGSCISRSQDTPSLQVRPEDDFLE
jgi:hypothetical protein